MTQVTDLPRSQAMLIRHLQYEIRAEGLGLSSHDACCCLRHNPSSRINDVIGELAPCLPLKEALQDHSNGSCANLPSILLLAETGTELSYLISLSSMDQYTSVISSMICKIT